MNQAVQGIITGFEQARNQAAERQRAAVAQQQADQQQANADRTYQLATLNALIGLQSQMPKAEDPRKQLAREEMASLDPVRVSDTLAGVVNDSEMEQTLWRLSSILGDEGAHIQTQLKERPGSADALARRDYTTDARRLVAGKTWADGSTPMTTADVDRDLVAAIANDNLQSFADQYGVTVPQAAVLAGKFQTGNGGVPIELMREHEAGKFMRSPEYLNAVEAIAAASSSASKKAKDTGLGDEDRQISDALQVLQSNSAFANSARGKDVIDQTQATLSGLRGKAKQADRDTPLESFTNQMKRRQLEVREWLAGGAGASKESAAIDEIVSSFRAANPAGDIGRDDVRGLVESYNSGDLSTEDGQAYAHPLSMALAAAGFIGDSDVRVVSQTLASGDPEGPKSSVALQRAETALSEARTYALKIDSEKEPLLAATANLGVDVAKLNAQRVSLPEFSDRVKDQFNQLLFIKGAGGANLGVWQDAARRSQDAELMADVDALAALRGDKNNADAAVEAIRTKYPDLDAEAIVKRVADKLKK